MDLRKDLKRLVERRGVSPRPLADIELNGKRLHRRMILRNSVVGLIIILAVAFISLKALREDDGKGVAGNPSEESIPASVSQPREPLESPSESQRLECDQIDSCNENEGLDYAEEWLGNRLEQAGLEYLNDYREDSGGGHYLPEWETLIQVLRPIRPSDEAQAAYQEYGDPLWEENGTNVFGQAKEGSPVAYFYWRAGDVDTFAQITWQESGASNMRDFKPVFEKLIGAQKAHPYFDKYES